MYGGHRPGNNLYTSSIVCLDAKTGKRVWHFQTVHHDLFDYDNPAAPILIDITVGGRRDQGAGAGDEAGFVFVLDRATGKPVWPIEERPVPQSTVPGEKTWPDAAVSDQAAALRAAGAASRRPHRLHAGAARRSARDRQAVRDRSAVHAAVGARRRPGATSKARCSCPGSNGGVGVDRRRVRSGQRACSTSRRRPIRSRRICCRASRTKPTSATAPDRARWCKAARAAADQAAVRPHHGDRPQHAASTRGWWRTATVRATIPSSRR